MGTGNSTTIIKKNDEIDPPLTQKQYVKELLENSKEAYEGSVEDDLLYVYSLVKAGLRDKKIDAPLARKMVEVLAKAQIKLSS